jgi:hypothetical protein
MEHLMSKAANLGDAAAAILDSVVHVEAIHHPSEVDGLYLVGMHRLIAGVIEEVESDRA